MYLLQWPKNVSVDARENKTETWTLYWYLNGMGIQNGSGPLLPLPRHAGANFDWRVFDNKAGRYIYATRSCNSNILLVPVANVSAPASATYSLKTTTNQTAKSICDLPQSDEITDEPAALNGQPVFGCASFALYVVDLAITGLSWPFVFWFNGAHHWQKRARISLACIKSLAAIVSVAAAALLAAGIAWVAKATGPGGASPGGISSQDAASSIPATSDSFPVISSSAVVINATTNSTSPSSSIPTSTMPTITPGSTASNLIWIAAIGQIFAAVFFIASCLLLWQQERHQGQPGASSGRQERNWSNMRQRPGSLPVYRSRRSHHNGDGGDDDEDLPPYQRDDPLGRPPSIPGYTISNGCTVTFSASVVASGPDCIPLNRVGSGSGSSNISSSSSSDANVEAAAPSISTRSSSLVLGGVSDSSSGRRSPSPDYEEVVGVEPASLLSSGGASRCTPHESD
ncbi:hypothetical protein SCUCBS95973_008581 [Sporothrix curviconia]|uniref:Integral membrane protein n=1 Tax=Sporothrix curviconia TaxID=1260050 RepID=A0ABP0CMS8_9PEZI